MGAAGPTSGPGPAGARGAGAGAGFPRCRCPPAARLAGDPEADSVFIGSRDTGWGHRNRFPGAKTPAGRVSEVRRSL